MFRRLIPILFSVLLASSALAGQSWVGPGAWVDLGPAPVAVTPMAGASVYLQQGASAPANTSAASLVGGASTAVAASMTFAGTQHVFAIGAPGAYQVEVDVEAVVAAASTPAIASDGGGMAHITNWPSVFAVTWSGQSVAISNWPSTWAITASSLPLPSGAATASAQAAILAALGSPFQAGASIGNTAFGASGPAFAASGKTPITSTFTATGASASFTPIYGRDFNVSIEPSTSFVGSVQLERQFAGESTWNQLTAAGTQLYVWTAPASETASEPEVGVVYRLHCTAWTSGTISYRISQ